MTYFTPICKSIKLTFKCPDCGEMITTKSLEVPLPDFSAEKNSDSMNYEVYEAECGNCNHSIQITVYNAMYGGEVEVEGVDEIDIEEELEEENDDYGSYVFDLTPEKISIYLDEVENLNKDTRKYLYRQLFAGAITSMEAYLSSTLIHEVLSSEDNKRRFVERYTPYRKEMIPYSSLYKKIETIDSTIKRTLHSLIYHHLEKIKPIYKDTLGIDLGDIGELMKAVQIRHDIVHRSGKDKEGHLHSIGKGEVIDLVERVSSLMSIVNSKLEINHPSDEVDSSSTDIDWFLS